jgi:DNA-binding SARP family transcriptional activator/energy-coupling factor transporter ATP-binding protein EcfA2
MTDLVRIFTFGGLRIEQNGKQFPPFTTRKEEALLVYLAATRRAHPREVLADLLWDERTQAQALANLRVVLSGLRQRLAEYLNITRQMVGLENPLWLDANELESMLAEVLAHRSGAGSIQVAEQLDKALRLYQGEFLSGFYVRDSQIFEDWMLQERERFHRQVIQALHHLVEIYLNCGAYAAGIAQATRLLQMDSLREEAHQQMMKLLVQSGQRSAALNQFETCRRLLEKELGVEPSEETLALYDTIHSERVTIASSYSLVSSPAMGRERENPDILENPYKGLQAFQEQDSENFFGRESFVADLVLRLKSSADESKFLALVGPSGSGKSSIIKAGLIPVLRRESHDHAESWVIAEMVPGFQPLEELAAALSKVSATPQAEVLAQLRRSENGLLQAAQGIFDNQDERLLLIIDQFEELFTLVEDEPTRKLFLDNLQTAATAPASPVYVLISLRADFYDRPMLYPDFGNLVFNNHVAVLALTPDELERAIVRPAARIGVSFEPGLEATIISEVAEQPGMLPLLQYALTELYIHRQERTLTLAAYREMGGAAALRGTGRSRTARRPSTVFEISRPWRDD